MSLSRHWWRALTRLVVIICLGALFGIFLGNIVGGLSVALALVLLFWNIQLFRMERWLSNSKSDPPEASGVWGRLFDHVYRLQRQSKEAQGRLASSLEYLQASLKSLRDAALITDPRGNIVWVNDSAESLLSITLVHDVGRPLLNLMRAPELSEYLTCGEYKSPLRMPPTPEQDKCLQVEVSIFGSGDRLIFVKDITEQYKLEMMRRDFVGNVSHELRTPLTVLKGYVENLGLLSDDVVTQIQRPLSQMDMQVGRMEVLLKDLLWLSRIESIENTDKTSPVNVGNLIVEIVDGLRAAWPDRLISLCLSHEGLIFGDVIELHSAVSNLIVNALKYSDSESEVTVEWFARNNRPVLRVVDRGEGIEEHHIPRLTERFYRIDKSRSQSTGGTGLGLAIVKHVALSHNAELKIESIPGEGSVFSILFSANEATL
ncbi:MAG: phosphate regulon sensor histidine kinase PhoR [Luminiphilus sp.]|nr:phosphate regulon sensor histidine kinase PhoR [Luminiphilus sp.]